MIKKQLFFLSVESLFSLLFQNTGKMKLDNRTVSDFILKHRQKSLEEIHYWRNTSIFSSLFLVLGVTMSIVLYKIIDSGILGIGLSILLIASVASHSFFESLIEEYKHPQNRSKNIRVTMLSIVTKEQEMITPATAVDILLKKIQFTMFDQRTTLVKKSEVINRLLRIIHEVDEHFETDYLTRATQNKTLFEFCTRINRHQSISSKPYINLFLRSKPENTESVRQIAEAALHGVEQEKKKTTPEEISNSN